MRFPTKKHSGFTLIEIIVTLGLMAIMAAVGGMFIVQGVRGYLAVQANTRITQQAQLAMARISREIIEMTSMTENGTSTTLSIAYIGGNHTIGLDDGKIKINNTGGALSSGDILVDNVQSFALTYWTGNPPASSSSWPVSNDIQLLSAIDIDLRLNSPVGGALQFASRVAPRNNKNLGGAAPTTSPPAAPSYHCVVATAAYGDPHHPHVCLLRDFRDRYLLTWQGGRLLSRAYYTCGPAAADWLQGCPPATAVVRILLLPLVGLAFLALYAPVGLFFLPLMAFSLSKAWNHMRKDRLGRQKTHPIGGRGSILIGMIVTMLIIALLGVAMVTLFSSSTFSQVADASGRRAYFLAESGFRYAASEYLNAASDSAKLTVMSNLNGKTCNLLNNDGSFRLQVYPYWFTVSSISGTNLTVQVNGQLESSLSLSSGYLWINDTSYPYTGTSGATAGATSFAFVASTAWPAFSAGTEVFSAVLPSTAQTVTRGGNLTLSAAGVSALPLINGNIRLNPPPAGTLSSTVYTYQTRSGNTLMGIDLANTGLTWTNLAVTASTNIILDKFLRLDSTGTFSGYSRQILYNVPIGWTSGGTGFQQAQYQDQFSTMSNWQTPEGGGGGSHSIQTIDGGSALKVDSAPSVPGVGNWAMIFFNSGNTLTNLAQAWMDAQGFLTYDLQVKVRNAQPYFMAGMGFRARNSTDGTDLYTYGISFLKPRQTRLCFFGCGSWSAPSDLDTNLIPDYTSDAAAGSLFSNPGLFQNLEQTSQPFIGTQSRYGLPVIVLWQRTSAGTKWLAYRTLTTADGIVTYNSSTKAYRLVNWSTLMARVAEGHTLAFNNGGGTSGTGVPIKVGDTIQTIDGLKSARVVMTPILTAGSWTARNAQGTFVLANIQGTAFATGDILYVGSTQLARANGNLNTTKRNYIRVYYTRPTALGTANAVETDNNRLGNPRDSAYWPPDDLTDLTAANDYATLVQWTDYNTGISAVTSTNEPNAIIMTSDLVTGAWTTTSTMADFSGDNISLMTLTNSASSTYYEDFAIQLFVKAGTGFLPPIQQ